MQARGDAWQVLGLAFEVGLGVEVNCLLGNSTWRASGS